MREYRMVVRFEWLRLRLGMMGSVADGVWRLLWRIEDLVRMGSKLYLSLLSNIVSRLE
jgi:hypothetical protein